MVVGLIAAIIIAFFSMFIPGLLLAFALLRRTELHNFEIVTIGFIFGLIAPATLTWAESYLANSIHFFSFSLVLFELNALLLTIIGIVLCLWQGVFADFFTYVSSMSSGRKESATKGSLDDIRRQLNHYSKGKEVVRLHIQEENELRSKQNAETVSISNLNQEERSRIEAMHRESQERLREDHLREETQLLADLGYSPVEGSPKSAVFKPPWWVWALLLILMIVTFYTRMQSIVIAPKFFEFDPYFDMIDAHYILTYGHQLLLDPSAWPVVTAGTNHRLQPLIPYLEAFWYTLVNDLQYHKAAFSTNLMSYIGGIYPPITAALLVFSIFVLLYHEYDEKIGLIGAAFTATMPVLFTTFIAGEQLVEPWGIFALFFFFATYMLAVRNMKDKRLAILAGIAFASNFLGAHYYTVTAGVLAIYIIIEGVIDILRNESLMDFYKMNAIVLITIAIFYAIYAPYQATLQSNLSSLIGIPIVIAAPLFALVAVAILDFVPKLLAKSKIIIKEANFKTNLGFMVLIALIATGGILFTKAGAPVLSYINLSKRFTTPSKPLFMTVQEYIPTGPSYSFGAQGFGSIGSGILNIPILIWAICIISVALIILSIAFRKSKTGIFYIAIALPLMAAGFSEVKYLPHFGTVYILLFCIMLGEILYLISSNYYKGTKNRDLVLGIAFAIGVISLLLGFSLYSFGTIIAAVLGVVFLALAVALLYLTQKERGHYSIKAIYTDHPFVAELVLIIGLYFLFGLIFALAAIAFILIYRYGIKQTKDKYNTRLILACVLLALFSLTNISLLFYGESGALYQSFSAQIIYITNSPANACTILSNNGNSLGYNTYCNTIPQYWLNSMTWIRNNVGPSAPRVLAWWDYGDWINWFGNSNAVLRGDNSVASEDYAVAAEYVMGSKAGYTPQSLASYMTANQTRYVLFDQDLISKWGALDFLACIHTNGTTQAYATAQGSSSNPPVPYVLGTSQCEIAHDPEFVLLPLSALIQTNQTQSSISNYCSISTSNTTYINGYLIIGNNFANSTVCIDSTPNSRGVLSAYTSSGQKLNAYIQSSQYLGVQNVQGSLYVEFLMIYTPNGPNDTITNAPSDFYDSNYYKGFALGDLPGFKQVYPVANATSNGTGINYINGTYPVRIYELVNYTGGSPQVPPKPSWINNNDIMP
jgi:asparagine N-glycosylation enzyme membrane subunit Stt3